MKSAVLTIISIIITLQSVRTDRKVEMFYIFTSRRLLKPPPPLHFNPSTAADYSMILVVVFYYNAGGFSRQTIRHNIHLFFFSSVDKIK